jgi:hypothetical protein
VQVSYPPGVHTVRDEGADLTRRSILNLVGRGVLADDVAPATRVRIDDYKSMLHWTDDFTTGNATSGQLGAIGALFNGTGATVARQTSEVDHLGLWRVTSGAVSGDHANFMVSGVGGAQLILPAATFDVVIVCRFNQAGSTLRHRIGLGNSLAAEPPADGCYIEQLSTDTEWFGVNRAGAVESRTPALLTSDTSFHTFRVRRVDALTIGFTIDAGSESLLTANIPTTGLSVGAYVEPAEAVAKSFDMDLIDILVTGLSRP